MLMAGKLARAGCSVTLVTRTEEQAESIRMSGLTVRDRDGTALFKVRVDAVDIGKYNGTTGPAADWILLAVKQKDIGEPLLQALARQADRSPYLCCFQNGIGHLEKLVPVFGPERLYAAVTTEGARRTSLTDVRHTGSGCTHIGLPGIREASAASDGRLRELVELLRQAGIASEMSNLIETEIWNKLIMNVVINPLTAILGVPNGGLLESEHTLGLMKSLYEEARGLADALGIGLAEDLWTRLLAVCRATAPNRSSMLQDLEAGRVTELEWLNGSLLREAAESGVSLPAHETVYHLVKSKEEQSLSEAVNRQRLAEDFL